MPVLKAYHAFAGRHWETGTITNALAYQGVTAPHTGQPLTEALLMGIAGGIVVGYFTFDYQGHDPILALLTRNTFTPLSTLYDRLALAREVFQTTKAETAQRHLINALENGSPAIVWADAFSLPYNAIGYDDGNWAMNPVLVYGCDGDQVWIADRSRQPLTAALPEFTQARARVKDDKFRLMVLDAPDLNRLAAAVQKGIWQTISLYTEQPPKGKKDNFGAAALQHWAKLLTNTRNKQGWARHFPPGIRLYAALTGGFSWIMGRQGAADGAERGLYADFLDEAAVILNKPDLKAVAEQFRVCKTAWDDLGRALLPESVPLLAEARDLLRRDLTLFYEQGMSSLAERLRIKTRLADIRAAAADFPLDESGVAALYADLADHVTRIHDLEYAAILALQAVMA